MKRIAMLCPASSQPRYMKRASQLAEEGAVSVYAFERGYYTQNKFPSFVSFYSLGFIPERAIFKRLLYLLKAFLFFKKEKKGYAYFYSMSIDMYILARLAGFKPGVYEVGDIRTLDGNKKLLTFLERWVVKDSKAVVLTSKYFYTNYYKGFSSEESKFFVIENKLDKSFFESFINDTSFGNKKVKSKKIRIGVVGFLRYERPLKNLVEFVKNNQESYEIVCFGDGPLRDYILSLPKNIITYHGSFKYPDDLIDLYKNIDVNYVVYDTTSENVKLALPNKLYESIFFETPIIVAEGTALSDQVQRMNVGKSVSVDNICSFEKSMSGVNFSWIRKLSLSCSKLTKVDLLDNGQEVLNRIIKDKLQ